MTYPAIDTGLMLTMTVQAPPHLETGGPGDALHGSNCTVTGSAIDFGANVHHVREIDMIRQAVNSDPGDRLPFFLVRHQFFDLRCVRRNELMAGTAVSHCRNAGQRRLRSVAVTEEAMDAVITGMLFMAESERLKR